MVLHLRIYETPKILLARLSWVPIIGVWLWLLRLHYVLAQTNRVSKPREGSMVSCKIHRISKSVVSLMHPSIIEMMKLLKVGHKLFALTRLFLQKAFLRRCPHLPERVPGLARLLWRIPLHLSFAASDIAILRLNPRWMRKDSYLLLPIVLDIWPGSLVFSGWKLRKVVLVCGVQSYSALRSFVCLSTFFEVVCSSLITVFHLL